jgi:hypothetical protein
MILIKDENSKKARIVDLLIGDTFRWGKSNYILVDSTDPIFDVDFQGDYIAFNLNHWSIENLPDDIMVEVTHFKMEEV